MADDFEYRFSSKIWLPEIALYDFGRRYYSPELGRFISKDPIGIGGGLTYIRTPEIRRLIDMICLVWMKIKQTYLNI